MNLPILFVSIYILVDIVYVSLSKGFYGNVARRISGNGFPAFTATRVLGALVAYGSMVAAWLFFVPIAVCHYQKTIRSNTIRPWMVGSLVGAMYGFVLYGVFNGSLHVMFQNYDIPVVIRDMLWGVSWSTVLTAIYAYFAASNCPK